MDLHTSTTSSWSASTNDSGYESAKGKHYRNHRWPLHPQMQADATVCTIPVNQAETYDTKMGTLPAFLENCLTLEKGLESTNSRSEPAAEAEHDSDQDPINISCEAIAIEVEENEPRANKVSSTGRDWATDSPSEHQEAGQESQDSQSLDEGARSASPGEISTNTESEDGYESNASGRSVVTSSRNELVARLMDEIYSSFLFQVNHRPRAHGERGQSTTNSSPSSTQRSISTVGLSNNVLSANRRKRAQEDDEDPEDEDGRKRQRSKTEDSSNILMARSRCFACPFHKYDASTYSNRNEDPRLALKYRSCGPPGWPTIGKMKEHLYRSHQTPIHCPRCWNIMKTEAALGEHARATSQCDVLPPPLRWIPREVVEKLKNRKKAFAGQTDEDTWKYIFGLLFPDTAEIPSPYYNDELELNASVQRGSPTSHAIAVYEEYARAHLPRLVEEALETTVEQQTQPIEEGLRRALAEIVRDCQSRLAQNFRQHRSSDQDIAGLDTEALPSFYIEPLNLADDSVFVDPSQIDINGLRAAQPRSDSGYASGDYSLRRHGGALTSDWIQQNTLESFDETVTEDLSGMAQNALDSFDGPINEDLSTLAGDALMQKDWEWTTSL